MGGIGCTIIGVCGREGGTIPPPPPVDPTLNLGVKAGASGLNENFFPAESREMSLQSYYYSIIILNFGTSN